MEPLFDRLSQHQCRMFNDGTTLFVEETPAASQLIADYEREGGITNKSAFNAPGETIRWIELPYAYIPAWKPCEPDGSPIMSAEESEPSSPRF